MQSLFLHHRSSQIRQRLFALEPRVLDHSCFTPPTRINSTDMHIHGIKSWGGYYEPASASLEKFPDHVTNVDPSFSPDVTA